MTENGNGLPARGDLLEANLRLIAARSPRAAEAIRAAGACPDLQLSVAEDAGLTGVLGLGEQQRRLASKHAPMAEGERLASTIDPLQTAVVAFRGFGVGHHVAAAAHRLAGAGAVLVFEPDAGLLRAVFERIDCGPWLSKTPVFFFLEAEDTGQIAAAMSGLEALVSIGTRIVDHPPSRQRLGPAGDQFAAALTTVVRSVRTHVVTSLVQIEGTVRNLLNNLRWYSTVPGITDLAGVCAGYPAVTVAAGPSLRRNIDLLREPGVCERVVIIAAQTVLRTLLDKGIRPHFVTALDYHEISRRFYEGLSAEDVAGITLVVEPQCNPAILKAWPGRMRCIADGLLDRVLGPGYARPMGSLPAAATVAHLSYYLARYLGCDPVILVGQDLGFTDGQYYGAEAAIHRVWAGELNEFCTLEMLEWQRIVRMRGLLTRVTDQLGRAMYTDEQMSTYLVQFERDFAPDVRAGKAIIDATEGGARKQHTVILSLREALEKYAKQSGPAVPRMEAMEPLTNPARAKDRVEELRADAVAVKQLCGATLADLRAMQGMPEGSVRLNRLIDRVQERGREAPRMQSYWLVQHFNQTGQLKRLKADRALRLETGLAPAQRQKRQIERDIVNVEWLEEAAQRLAQLLAQAGEALTSGEVATRDLAERDDPLAETRRDGTARKRVIATVWFDAERSALGYRRRIEAMGTGALARTLARLGAARELDGVVVLTASAGGAALKGLSREIKVHVVDGGKWRARGAAVRGARLWSRQCWRGGIAGMSAFDEVFEPGEIARVLAEQGADAAVLVGADWVMVDPALTDAVVARYREQPQRHQLTFTQASVGLSPCVVDRGLAEEFAKAKGALSTIGGLLSYHPAKPQMDPIAAAVCVHVPAHVRDLGLRCVWDDTNFRAAMGKLAKDGFDAWGLSADDLAPLVRASMGELNAAPEVLEVRTAGMADAGGLAAVMRGALARQPGLAVTLVDDLAEGPWRAAASMARALSVPGVQLRTTWRAIEEGGHEGLVDALDLGVNVLNIEMPADAQETWRVVTGSDTRERVWGAMQALIDARNERGPSGLPATWIVARITRRDAVYEDIETFYDRWLLAAGACVIEPSDGEAPDARIQPLPAPAQVLGRRRWSRLVVHADQTMTDGLGEVVAPRMNADGARIGEEELDERVAEPAI